MLIKKNGFVKCGIGSWINLSRIIALTLEEKDGGWAIFAIISEAGNGIILELYDSKDEAQAELNVFVYDENL